MDAFCLANIRDMSIEEANLFLETAVAEGADDRVRWLLGLGADINLVTADGSTLLHLATLHNQINTVAILLEAGANPNQKDRDSCTASQIAARFGYTTILDMLTR